RFVPVGCFNIVCPVFFCPPPNNSCIVFEDPGSFESITNTALQLVEVQARCCMVEAWFLRSLQVEGGVHLNRRIQRFPHPEISADPLYEGVLNVGAPRHHALTVNQPTITDVAHRTLCFWRALHEQIKQPVTHLSSKY